MRVENDILADLAQLCASPGYIHAIAHLCFRDNLADPNFNPFDSGETLREPIFYGGESAYVFQYRELSLKKYALDEEWLKAHKGFPRALAPQLSEAEPLQSRFNLT